ncbi:something about silencing protein 10 [Marasmius crinis-equi]|uniref:Something about silencing protein 10 n=1 Tax=Marasmius crinis-equi TaxID=585013 RepID=A0ABR3FZM7_9AGAR
MPRRRSTKRNSTQKQKARSVNRNDSKLTKWNDISDIPLDEEDEFHASRDQILLDGEHDGDEDLDDDEVFALKGMPDDDDEDDEDEGEKEYEDEDEDVDMEDDTPSSRKSSGKKKQKKKASEESDDSESEEEAWGKGKAAYYASNDAQLESDDEEALALELEEAKRLQKKSRENMTDADFGLEDIVDLTTTEDDMLKEPAFNPAKALPKDKNSIIRHLERTDPLSLALARDWSDTTQDLLKAKERVEQLEATDPSSPALGMIHLHYQTLMTYATALAFYLHLRAQEKYAQKPEQLNDHPVLKRLLLLKSSLQTLEAFNFAGSPSDLDDDDSDFDLDEEELDEDELMADAKALWEADSDSEWVSTKSSKEKPTVSQEEDIVEPIPPKKKRKTTESGKKSVPVFDLVEPEFVSSKASGSRATNDSFDVYGEATSLQHADAADKSARKKSLRFHTSKIESTSARRQGARNATLGGDDDIPYRERRREKEDRLAKEAGARVQNQGGMDLDDTEPEPRREVPEEGEDGYYELVAKKSKEKKEKKKADYEAARAERYGLLLSTLCNSTDWVYSVELDEAASGPRSATRAILANKGLTPHRAKSVRNPRVKKREKFEKAKRKVASQRAVYKGGISDTGRYDGEKTGISKVVKSVRLG